ncbi:MAG: aminopeptidase [Faecousia sp.]
MTTEELRQSLLLTHQNGYGQLTSQQRGEMEQYAARYSAFMSTCKTEREAVSWAVAAADARGFRPLVPGMDLKPGDKVYLNNRGKSLILAVIGSAPMEDGVNICGAHIDCPRMDLKPNPLYEDAEIAYFKTHYYGGIKKYQWVCVPLAIHGIVFRKDGSSVNIVIGEDETDPVLVISDLLIHLSADQLQKPLAKGIEAEQLNVILGSEPLTGEGSDLVKLNIMKLLHERYNITEADFHSAELCIVPAGKCREVGLDRSLLGAYGHDDRVCAYAELEAILSLDAPVRTAVCVLADKEEIGSVGISSMESMAFEYFMDILCQSQNSNMIWCFTNSFCLSADVSMAFDPNFPEVSDPRNSARLNHGVGVCKYTGTKGKSFASDASAEVMSHIRTILDNAGVLWQMSTLGKVDQGGGGTIAYVMANRNIPTVDAGVPVLSMHAPFELVTKLDCYMTYLACAAVFNS